MSFLHWNSYLPMPTLCQMNINKAMVYPIMECTNLWSVWYFSRFSVLSTIEFREFLRSQLLWLLWPRLHVVGEKRIREVEMGSLIYYPSFVFSTFQWW